MPQWRGISVVLQKIGHALDTGLGQIEKPIGFVHVHFLCTRRTSIPVLYRKGFTECLTALGMWWAATVLVCDGVATKNKEDEVFKAEKDYLPPEQVSLHVYTHACIVNFSRSTFCTVTDKYQVSYKWVTLYFQRTVTSRSHQRSSMSNQVIKESPIPEILKCLNSYWIWNKMLPIFKINLL